MNIDDLVRVDPDHPSFGSQAGRIISGPVNGTSNRYYMLFLCGVFTGGWVESDALTPIGPDQLSEPEAAVLMRETLL